MSANVNLAGALLQNATFSEGQLQDPNAIDFSHAMGNVNVVNADGLHLGQLDIAQVDAYRAGEVALSPGRADAMDAGRASAVDSVCQSYREAAAVHFVEKDALGAAADVVAGLGDAVVQAMGLETENPAIGPPGEEQRLAAEQAAFEKFAEAHELASELEAAGLEDAYRAASAAVEESISRG